MTKNQKTALILAGVAVAAYLVYRWYTSQQQNNTNSTGLGSNLNSLAPSLIAGSSGPSSGLNYYEGSTTVFTSKPMTQPASGGQGSANEDTDNDTTTGSHPGNGGGSHGGGTGAGSGAGGRGTGSFSWPFNWQRITGAGNQGWTPPSQAPTQPVPSPNWMHPGSLMRPYGVNATGPYWVPPTNRHWY